MIYLIRALYVRVEHIFLIFFYKEVDRGNLVLKQYKYNSVHQIGARTQNLDVYSQSRRLIPKSRYIFLFCLKNVVIHSLENEMKINIKGCISSWNVQKSKIVHSNINL